MSVLQAIMQLIQDHQEVVEVAIQELPFYPEESLEETTKDPFHPDEMPLLSSSGDT